MGLRSCVFSLVLMFLFLVVISHECVAAPVVVSGSTWTDLATGIDFVKIPAGCFQMGSPLSEKGRKDDEGPAHEVCLDGFLMGKYEVTQKQWQRVMGQNPSYYKEGDQYPVEQVSWDDVNMFIEKMNKRSGQKFRLPTEAEWEYAARAKTETARYWDASQPACSFSNVHDKTSKQSNRFSWPSQDCDDGFATTAPVGQYEPNGFGLYDMIGNVWEWCQDYYSSGYYAISSKGNPQGPAQGSLRVMRGSDWYYGADYMRSAKRRYAGPAYRESRLGFRLVVQD